MAGNDGKKVCPILFVVNLEDRDQCLGEKCAMHVKLYKPNPLAPGVADPNSYFYFEGCGLIRHIPWVIKHRDKKETPKVSE